MAITPSAQEMLETLRDPRWALPDPQTEQSPIALDCMQNGKPGIFVASPLDPEPHGVEVWNDCKAGKYGDIGPYVAPVVTVEEAVTRQYVDVQTYMQDNMAPRPPGPDRQEIYTELEAATTTQGYHVSQIPQPWDRPLTPEDQVFLDAGLAAYNETVDYLNAQVKSAKLPQLKIRKR